MLYEINQINAWFRRKFKGAKVPDGDYQIPVGYRPKKRLVRITDGRIHIPTEQPVKA